MRFGARVTTELTLPRPLQARCTGSISGDSRSRISAVICREGSCSTVSRTCCLRCGLLPLKLFREQGWQRAGNVQPAPGGLGASTMHSDIQKLDRDGFGANSNYRRLLVPSSSRFEVSGPLLIINSRAAMAISMALHELCTNAVKYGALRKEHGLVRNLWSVKGAGGA
jgi:hypothetical protein